MTTIDTKPIPYEDFDLGNTEKTGGLSGSVAAKDSKGKRHQVKFSVEMKKLWGRVKAHLKGFSDH